MSPLCQGRLCGFRPDVLHPRVYLSVQLNSDVVWPRTLSAGGDDGIRTHDPLLAGQVLSQLSYTPM